MTGPAKPILYLDVDDTLLRFPPDRTREWWLANKGGAPAEGVAPFLEWAVEHCDVRWLTFWTIHGVMHPELRTKLARLLRVSEALLLEIENPLGWGGIDKTTGIDWEAHAAGTRWAWLEDGISKDEMRLLESRQAAENFFKCNTSQNARTLVQIWPLVAEHLGLYDTLPPR